MLRIIVVLISSSAKAPQEIDADIIRLAEAIKTVTAPNETGVSNMRVSASEKHLYKDLYERFEKWAVPDFFAAAPGKTSAMHAGMSSGSGNSL